jgi:hypothetical protein
VKFVGSTNIIAGAIDSPEVVGLGVTVILGVIEVDGV